MTHKTVPGTARRHVLEICLTVCLADALLTTGLCAQAPGRDQKSEYWSPDGALVARVLPASASHPTESIVEIQSSNGTVLLNTTYASSDGQHGYGVGKAQWTPDSRFFVFNLQSSGGHQPWHSPVMFFRRDQRDIMSLDDALDNAVMNNGFSVEAPDKVIVQLYYGGRRTIVSLSSLSASEAAPSQ